MDWHLAFADEFDAKELDLTKWGTVMGFAGTHGPRYHNEFYLSYTDDEDVIVQGGILSLRTDRRTVFGSEGTGVFHYTQGLVSTEGKFTFAHGRIEIRAKYPGGKGLWPCLWLMPAHLGWPPEIDIAEYYAGQKTMHHGLAYGGLYDSRWDSIWDSITDFEDDWHVYALEWSPGRLVWTLDGVVRKTIVADYVPDTPMFIILSNSVSSVSGPSGEPDEKTVFPNAFTIDYVRVYQPSKVAPARLEMTLAEPLPAPAPPVAAEPAPVPEPAP